MLAAYALVSSHVKSVCDVKCCMTERGPDAVFQVMQQGKICRSWEAA